MKTHNNVFSFNAFFRTLSVALSLKPFIPTEDVKSHTFILRKHNIITTILVSTNIISNESKW